MRTVIVVDSTYPVNCRRVDKSVSRGLVHFGVYCQTMDLARQRIAERDLDDISLLVLGQEGIGKSLGGEECSAILKAVYQRGMGLLILDGYLECYPASFLKDLRLPAGYPGRISCLGISPGNPVLQNPAVDRVELNRPLLGYTCPEAGAGWNALLEDEQGNACAFYRNMGRGKLVVFLLSAALWHDEYLGYAGGLDGIFRMSIAWASRKPCVMKSMPPFITARIDDVSFSNSHGGLCRDTLTELKWLDMLNAGSFIPNVGVFIDEIAQTDARRLRQKYYGGLAEVSAHAFRLFPSDESVDAHSIYMQHTGKEFSRDELAMNFQRVDNSFEQWGITPARTVNAHLGQVGLAALPFLRERGLCYLMNTVKVGSASTDKRAHEWDVEPYGKAAFSLGFIPEAPDFFNATAMPVDGGSSDFLAGCTVFRGESGVNNVAEAIKKGVRLVKSGIESGFFGCLFTRETRIACLQPDEWSKIVKGISSEIKKYPHMFKSYDYISAYAANRTFYDIDWAEDASGLSVRLKGRSTLPQYLSVFYDENGRTLESFLEVPPFEKLIQLNFRI